MTFKVVAHYKLERKIIHGRAVAKFVANKKRRVVAFIPPLFSHRI